MIGQAPNSASLNRLVLPAAGIAKIIVYPVYPVERGSQRQARRRCGGFVAVQGEAIEGFVRPSHGSTRQARNLGFRLTV